MKNTKATKQQAAPQKVVIGNRNKKTVMVAATPKPQAAAVPAKPKVKKVRKPLTAVGLAAGPLIVEFAKVGKHPAVVMPYIVPPFTKEAGPYVEIVVKGLGHRKDAPKTWVRVTEGNQYNGSGHVVRATADLPFAEMTKVRFGGGTDLTPPRLFADNEGPVASRKAVSLV